MSKINKAIKHATDSGATVWFTSDTHINHKNIIKGISNWSDTSRCRDFRNRDDHNWSIFNSFNEYVQPDDILFHLGDVSFGGISSLWYFRKNINCRTIYLCYGNHDHHIKRNKELPNVVRRYYETHADNWSYELVSWDTQTDGKYISTVKAKELFADTQNLYDIEVHGHKITLCHYSMRTWFYHNKGSWMLYGHSHDTLSEQGKTMDVGVDSAFRHFGEYRPFSFQEIQKIMNNREIEQIDHHSYETNA